MGCSITGGIINNNNVVVAVILLQNTVQIIVIPKIVSILKGRHHDTKR